MKLTNKQLKQIIQEELRDVMRLHNPDKESYPEWPFEDWGTYYEDWEEAKNAWDDKKKELFQAYPKADFHGDRKWSDDQRGGSLEIQNDMDVLANEMMQAIQWEKEIKQQNNETN